MTKFAFVFPGQGSQSLGMLSEMAESQPIVQQVFAEASQALGYDLWQVCQEDADMLSQTQHTQPALLAASVALYRVWQQTSGEQPVALAGHSLGEYSALVCAGVIDFKEAIQLVHLRGQLMQQAVPEGKGAMAAILGLDNAVIEQTCAEQAQGDVVSAVNYNAVGQVVIAGEKAAVQRAAAACKELGAKKVVDLPVSVPSHCALMKPAAEKLAEKMSALTFNTPEITVIHNVDAQPRQEADSIRQALEQQLFSPVRWVETVEALHGLGVEVLVECGSGKVLSGLTKRIVRGLTAGSIETPAGLEKMTTMVNG
ncbi:ACP S-malonyltransferase [Pelagibaculum spongiae]|uniref:Malonyl CoA-acyl carrier protein transacylase n=1 Tax=Pelagibaculum spongiae TaxID=2080658 RepID=A0A2V1GXE0_9GAMM|nr:ACP S-malonyltransferase [Pelagibaculum spongiae]PVZ68934.1 [acyl-carrier-protein] S-malonyltransferase [Pelagibaculum spongiae]